MCFLHCGIFLFFLFLCNKIRFLQHLYNEGTKETESRGAVRNGASPALPKTQRGTNQMIKTLIICALLASALIATLAVCVVSGENDCKELR